MEQDLLDVVKYCKLVLKGYIGHQNVCHNYLVSSSFR